MQTKYPIILAHGIMIKDYRFFKAFGRIEKVLRNAGYSVYSSRTDGFGTVENNAEQLKAQIREILAKENVDKINVIAHSKGGLDSRYMIEKLDMASSVASLTTLCTPHKGSALAARIFSMPKWMAKMTAFWINFWYKIFGDKNPDALEVCRQLQSTEFDLFEINAPCDGVYSQSYSATLKRSRDDFVMGVPLQITKRCETSLSDGIVSVESAKYGEYKGDCLDESLSHSEIIDFMVKKKKREKIYAFYLGLCRDLAERGY